MIENARAALRPCAKSETQARKHHTRTTAKSKDEPRGNQQVDVRSQGTACRRRDGHHRTNDEEAVPATGVGKRTNEKLSQRHADHKR